MKFSVLLPTRNRLEYLKFAIESVLGQDYDNWEIIVSDNYSEENIQDYINSLGDSRIKYFRTNYFCPVTENWNNALEKSSGDYVIMLGDDDCLLKGYFSTSLELLKQNNFPQMIYNSALVYAYPNVIPGCENGHLRKYGFAPFFLGDRKPHMLSKEELDFLVKKIFDFNVMVNFNMQHSLVSRSLINELQKYGKFYQSPYPDYYATTAMLIKAKSILAVPYPTVVIGVTPKSFGYFYINDKENEGKKFLQHSVDENIYNKIARYIIPGTDMNICWLLAMETVKQNLKNEIDLIVNYKKFRFLQTLHQLKKFACREKFGVKDFGSSYKNLFWWEKIIYLIPFLVSAYIRYSPKNSSGKAWAAQMAYKFSHPKLGTFKEIFGSYKNMSDVFKQNPIESILKMDLKLENDV